MEVQLGDKKPSKFSYSNTSALKEQRACHITYTNQETHDLLRLGFDRSPMFNGAIKSSGPRYCPSIEDKINRFADKDRHQIFVEPEGWNTVEIYVNGFSTSLPEEVQFSAMKSIPGFEQVKMFRPGYAIEYDFFPPTQLKHTLETQKSKKIAIIGDMLELGSHSKFYHEQLAGIIKKSNIDYVYFVGREVLNTYRKLRNTDKYRIYEDVEQFREFFLEIINEKSIFLIKGSNGVGLHKLLNKI